jgi:hypothetical protein
MDPKPETLTSKQVLLRYDKAPWPPRCYTLGYVAAEPGDAGVWPFAVVYEKEIL